MISIQREDFNVGDEYELLRKTSRSEGAVVTFVGLVRDVNLSDSVTALELEHYPGMTEKVLNELCDEARQRWVLGAIRIIHRVGKLQANDQIVFVGVSSRHRQDAFDAAQFVMDVLKTQAPFWKKEHGVNSAKWVEVRETDMLALQRWQNPQDPQ
ncbi:molybdopterin synthase catalytic subunit MoaE [Aestuariibacter salexigens]|uniref:molybdopterin synthase catalytic subunit MoaE n=1 Tax=Aestuariibacter salexigens TaxID=226010 RepID=UPI00041B9D6F|nr:molybdopterin synthase catalytic subunit MoaE [Aestuariibacter salexigens]